MGDRDAEVPAAAVDAAIKATEDAQAGAMATVIAIVAATESVRLRRRPKTASGLRRLRRRIMTTHRAAAKATADRKRHRGSRNRNRNRGGNPQEGGATPLAN